MGLNGKRDRVEIHTEDLAALPVVRAWQTLAPHSHAAAVPGRVEMLRRRAKSVVYRLVGVGHGGADVIAKHCVRASALAESRVYDVLRDLPVTQLDYYGYVDGEVDDFGWIFLGDAAGEAFVPEDPGQQQLATRWLAALHVASSGTPAATSLPDHGPGRYLGHLQGGRAEIARLCAGGEIPAASVTVLNDVRHWLDRVESHWADIEAICRDVPWALVHGDFAARNVRLRCNGSDMPSLLVFDWEVAGWGMPGVDLGGVDLDVYFDLVQPAWPSLQRGALRRAAAAGRLLRGGIAAVHWDTQKFFGNPGRALDDMRIFRQRILDEMHELGWGDGTAPDIPTTPARGSPRAASDGSRGDPHFPSAPPEFPGAAQA